MGRKNARQGTMKLLYQMQVNNDFSEEATEIYFGNFPYEDEEVEYIATAIEKVKENIEEIDNYIKLYSEGWDIKRIAKVDLAVLRIAIYEILYRKDIPIEVSINEAIEIVKKYSTEDSFKFVNGVLGGVVRNISK